MSEKEKQILETIATAVPKMSEFDKKDETDLMIEPLLPYADDYYKYNIKPKSKKGQKAA